MKKLPLETERKIIELYITPAADGSWTGCKLIGEELHVSATSVQKVLKRNHIPIRNYVDAHSHGKRCKPIKNVPPPDSNPPLCKCGCGSSVVWNRSKNRWNKYIEGHYRQDAPYKHPEWLRREYVDNHRSLQNISNEVGVNTATIKKFMVRFGIEARTTKETLIANGSMVGSKNPAWKGGIAKWSYAPSWKRIAHDIRKRDEYTCQICKVRFEKSCKLLHVHHKDGDKFNNDPSNLVTVCATCHPKGKRNENGHL